MGSETEVFAASNLGFSWAKSVSDISPDDWSRCFASHRFARSYAYQEAVEASAPSGVEFHYLLISKSDSIVAMVGCFRYRIPLSTTATGSARKVMGFCEGFFPELFSINGFFVGQLTAVCDHLFGFEQIPILERASLLRVCEPAFLAKARSLGSSVILHKEIPQEDMEWVQEALGEDYVVAPSLPAMELKLESTESFPKQLRKKYRNHYNRRRKQSDERGLTYEIHRGAISRELAGEMERLYFQVLERSATQFERLSGDFFISLLERCPKASVVLCRESTKLVGFMVNVEAEHDFHGLYLGYDTNYREAAVYFNLIYQSLELALEKGFQSIHLGQTSYEVKSALGAKRTNLYLALRSKNPWIQCFLKVFSHHLFPKVDVPVRRAFPVNRRA